jgi:hypothetical protein
MSSLSFYFSENFFLFSSFLNDRFMEQNILCGQFFFQHVGILSHTLLYWKLSVNKSLIALWRSLCIWELTFFLPFPKALWLEQNHIILACPHVDILVLRLLEVLWVSWMWGFIFHQNLKVFFIITSLNK